jgi:feruloyl esterase
MKRRRALDHRRGLVLGIAGGVAAVLGTTPAFALPSCSVAALNALGVPNLTVTSVTPSPAICVATGTVSTSGFGAPDGSAGFRVQLPMTGWNGKFLFLGVGGFAGGFGAATNAGDPGAAAAQHFATAVTDTGHQAGSTDGRWALLAPGVPDEAKITDYYFRATHEVTVATKDLVGRFFGTSPKRAYFDGCSNGGRQALVEATKFPDDYDGIISGDPFMDIRSILAGASFDKVQLASADAYIPATKLPFIDGAVKASCDAVDGVKDGLIQNPANCSFDANTLVTPSCKASDLNCLTQAQANTLNAYITVIRDDDGRIVYTGQTISDLAASDTPLPPGALEGGGADAWTTGFVGPTVGFNAPEPWDNHGFSPSPIAWQFVDHFIRFFVTKVGDDPNFDMRSYLAKAGTVSDSELDRFDDVSEPGDGDVTQKLLPFIAKGKKMILYHGLSDPALPATRTIKWYEELALLNGFNFSRVQNNVRLFLVPGMHHCVGGPGPNVFDTLTALDKWVDNGVEPDAIVATHFVGNAILPPAVPVVDRTMPLCKFPEQARYKGTGDVNSAANWTCPGTDRSMLEVSRNGAQAGLHDLDFDADDNRGQGIAAIATDR